MKPGVIDLARDAIRNHGCDCDDEPGTCLSCVCRRAIADLAARADAQQEILLAIAGVVNHWSNGPQQSKSVLRRRYLLAVDALEAIAAALGPPWLDSSTAMVDNDPGYCRDCHGSGEGAAGGTVCSSCHGRGVVK